MPERHNWQRNCWTKKPPTQDGYYWWRQNIECLAVVVKVDRGWVALPGEGRTHQVQSFGGQWYGPLQEPGGDAIENCPLEKEKDA